MKNHKRVLALLGVVALLALVVITCVSAVTTTPQSPGFFLACVVSIIIIPILIYSFMLIVKNAKPKKESEDEITLSKRKEKK